MSDEPESDRFKGLDRAGFQAYIRHVYVKEGKPKYKVIIEQAAECGAEATLTTSTISATFKGKTYPKLTTAYALGLGIGGPRVAADFEEAWREAWENHRRKVHDQGMEEAHHAMHKEVLKENKRREGRNAGHYPRWWPKHYLLRGERLRDLIFVALVTLYTLFMVLRDFTGVF
ncbi:MULTISPECIES: hypothetical protein [Streptomyces]|uniref:hypothetical protein n=1 Tax=Streptomyces TaxID=1883 RepID=UPI00343805EC|nr:hypothetical protein OG714_38365 [Streptomyces sp. NBC_00989]